MERLVDIVTLSPSLMPTSIKVTCLQFLNVFLDYTYGMEWFLAWTEEQVLNEEYMTGESLQSSYRKLLEVVLSNQVSLYSTCTCTLCILFPKTVRVQSACSRLIRKAHLFELLTSFKTAVDNAIQATPTTDSPAGITEDFWNSKEKPSDLEELEEEEEEEERRSDAEQEKEGGDQGRKEDEENKMDTQDDQQKSVIQLPQETIKNITHLLDELYQMLKGVESSLMLLPPKAFPIKSMGMEQHGTQETFTGVARMLKHK